MSVLNPQIQIQASTNHIIHNHITVLTAMEISGYNPQYLRRLLRSGKLSGIKIGQMWLINLSSLENHIHHIQVMNDHRYGPRNRKMTVVDNGELCPPL